MTSDAVKVWDGWIRLFHWAIVLIIPAMWWTAENGEMTWHMRLGMVLMALLLFRILWGFVGSTTARFGSFVAGPGAVLSYLTGNRREEAEGIGHNPAGGWSVLALLLVMLAQVGLGLFSGDPYDGATGPLNHMVGAMTAGWMTDWHEIGFNVLLGLIGLHVAAILFYVFVKRENLVTPMVTGKRKGGAVVDGMESPSVTRGIVCLAIATVIPLWIWFGAG